MNRNKIIICILALLLLISVASATRSRRAIRIYPVGIDKDSSGAHAYSYIVKDGKVWICNGNVATQVNFFMPTKSVTAHEIVHPDKSTINK